MSERNDEGWFDYTFGMNDENGRLIQITVPAQTKEDAVRIVRQMLFFECNPGSPRWRFWLNDCRPY